MEKASHLVERLTRRVVDRPPERPEPAVRFHEHEVTVRPADDEDDRRDLWLRRNVLRLVEPVRIDVPFEMVHADEWQAGRVREAALLVRADQLTADEPGPDGRRNRVDLGELPARVAQGPPGADAEPPAV